MYGMEYHKFLRSTLLLHTNASFADEKQLGMHKVMMIE